mgnify:CR=1 FL=1
MPKYEEEMKEKKDDAVKTLKKKAFKNKGMSERDATINSMVSMKRDKTENKPFPSTAEPYEEDYPYGLRLRLENDDLEKLGLTELPDVGSNMHVMADATVHSVSSNQSNGDPASKKCVELQITGMKLAKGKGMQESVETEKEV